MQLKVLPLGAGQDVGRSCVLVSLGGKTIMFDCGMHMGYQDERRYPDFTYISRSKQYTQAIDAVIITHFHLDHCGALAYFTEVCGYDGPVYMTYPTKAMMPLMLEDYHKVMTERKMETEAFSKQNIRDCLRKVTAVDLHQTVQVDDELEIRAYYAGHVLGAAMFYVRVGNESVVYTGDYNMTPDRHLGAASIDRLRPDLLITESTYATTIRDSKRAREREFLNQVHETVVDRGGKVLIPVFALGRAQELLILLDEYWERLNLQVPIYFSAGMTSKANLYYQLFINWTNEKVKRTFSKRNPFAFGRMQLWQRNFIDQPGPCVLFATPGMLHGGLSLEVFKQWAPDERNLLILPGYCVSGTLGNKLMGGPVKNLEIDKRTSIDVNCRVKYLSFSAHADAKGILQLIQQCQPRHVMLVHGEKSKMEFLKAKITRSFGLACYNPPNGTAVTIQTSGAVPVDVSRALVDRALDTLQPGQLGGETDDEGEADIDRVAAAVRRVSNGWQPQAASQVAVEGVLVARGDPSGAQSMQLLDSSEVARTLGMEPFAMSLGCDVAVAAADYAAAAHVRPPDLATEDAQLEAGVSMDTDTEEAARKRRKLHPDLARQQAAARQIVQAACKRVRAAVGEHVDVEGGDSYITAASFHARLCMEEEEEAEAAAQATQMAVYGLAQNGRPIDCNKPSDTWLREAPRGAYTTARTVGQASVFELSFHLERLASSTRLMIQSDHKEQAHAVLQQHAELVDATLLRPKLLETVRAGIAAFCSRCPGFKGELKLTVLVTWHEAGHDIFCHVAALPDRPAPPVKTQVRGAPRTNASAKDSEWVRQRRVWEADKPADVNEVLLMDGEGNILEGLSSNFFAVVDGTLQTADEGILKGTVREVALQVCKREGIPVQLKAPNMRNFNRFEGAFISSTSRLVLPIDELEAQLGGALQGEATKRSFKREGSLVQRIEQLVLAEVEACSEPLES
ncbi:hypothetical protein WJX72_002754 [[Myrmecia] bisecta]|uniref:Integrator complex subunit 11 n=1 Tax=[Myrmecia] bisecta TaxID=41462 RepID=A0AAW1PP51_9CHLO